MRNENSLEKRLAERPFSVIPERTNIESSPAWQTELHHSLPMVSDFQPSPESSYVQRMHDHHQLPSTFPNWFEALKAGILDHCFGSDFAHDMSKASEISDEEISNLISELRPPPFLTAQQKLLLSELLQNVESWWSGSFAAMQSIHEESAQIMGFNALPIPPSPLPLYVQHQLKTIVRSVMQLLKTPTAAASSGTNDTLAIMDVHYWTLLAQEHRTNPKMVLREWMYQHFDKPYPTDQDKQMLSEVTGMSRSQVSNWFINARVRIWQPLILELGKELEDEATESGEEITSALKSSAPMGSGSYAEATGETFQRRRPMTKESESMPNAERLSDPGQEKA